MRVIATQNYLKKIEAQMLYDPDSPDEPLDMYDAKTFDIEMPEDEMIEDGLPNLTPEDAMGKMEEEAEEEASEVELPEIDEEEIEEYPAFPNALSALRWARQNKKVIRIEYTCKSGRAITRDVEPHGEFVAKTTSKRIYVTWDQQMGNVRSFIVVNISNYTFTGQKFDRFRFNLALDRRRISKRRRNKSIQPFKRTL
jgi:hypothetical protein